MPMKSEASTTMNDGVLKPFRIFALFSWDGLREGDELMDVRASDRLHALDVYVNKAMGYENLDDYLSTTGDRVYFEAREFSHDAEDAA
jgi:hypothetical protein